MEEALRTLLKGFVGPGVTVDWGGRPSGAVLPGIVLSVVSDRAAVRSNSGPSALSEARVQVDVYGTTYASAKGIARTIRAQIDGYKGGIFGGIFLDLVRDTSEPGDTPDARIYRCMLDLKVWYAPA